jgi:hypothetical protein
LRHLSIGKFSVATGWSEIACRTHLPRSVIIVVGLVILVLQHRGGPEPLEIRFDDPALDGKAIEVYVTGAVQKPGVYPLHEGDRIEDALAAAGGTTQDADTESLNLALRVRDRTWSRAAPQRSVGLPAVSTPAPSRININTTGHAGARSAVL